MSTFESISGIFHTVAELRGVSLLVQMIVIGMETSSRPCGSGSWLCQVRVRGQTDAFTVDRGQEEELGCLLLVQDDSEINSPALSTSPLTIYCLQLYTHVFGCVPADFIILFVKIMHWFSLSRRFCPTVSVSVEKKRLFLSQFEPSGLDAAVGLIEFVGVRIRG